MQAEQLRSVAAQPSPKARLEPGRLATYLGLALILSVFIVAVYLALTYERPSIRSDASGGSWALVTEILYLIGKVVFLLLALKAGRDLLSIGLLASRI